MKPTFAYIGRATCGCVLGSVADMDDDLKNTAKFVAEMIKNGLKIERVPLETVHMDWDCPHQEPKLAQMSFFGKEA